LIRLRQALREASLLLVVAAALGFIYTAATEKGLFARTPPGTSAGGVGVNAPQMISADEVWSLFQTGSALFVDSRHDFDFRAGHIKGAVNVPLKDFEVSTSALKDVAKDRLMVIYCDGADCNSSIELAVKLAKAGFKNTRISFGGWREWVEAKHPTEQTR
jgi:rhodanese-related sulfurtransferase